MGELVDLDEYRRMKQAEEYARQEAEVEALREEVAEIMARLSLDPGYGYYPIYPEGHESKGYREYVTIWPPPAGSYGYDPENDFSYGDYYEDLDLYSIDLTVTKDTKKEKNLDSEED